MTKSDAQSLSQNPGIEKANIKETLDDFLARFTTAKSPVIGMIKLDDPPVITDYKPEVDDATLRKPTAAANVITTRSGPGLLDLPSETRLMIFRHLLVYPHGSTYRFWLEDPDYLSIYLKQID